MPRSLKKHVLACSAVGFDTLARTFFSAASSAVSLLSYLPATLKFSSPGPPGQ